MQSRTFSGTHSNMCLLSRPSTSMATFSQASRTPWRCVNVVCQGAAVFLDGGAAELLHWAGGVALLGDCVGVYDLYHDLNPVARDFIAAVSPSQLACLSPHSQSQFPVSIPSSVVQSTSLICKLFYNYTHCSRQLNVREIIVFTLRIFRKNSKFRLSISIHPP